MATAKIEYDTNPLAKALAEFQADLPSVTLDGVNPHFNSKFTTLSHLTEKALPALAKHGLAFVATPQVTEYGFVVEAHLIHESGERLSASFPVTETNPQKIGSAVTYFRRYALASLTGIVADTDDDGEAASTQTKTERSTAAAKVNENKVNKAEADPIRDQIKAEFIDTKKLTQEDVRALVKKHAAALKLPQAHQDVLTATLASAQAGEVA